MKKKTYVYILAGLTISNIIWAMGYAFVGDFYPQLETLKEVLHAKAWFNGFILALAILFTMPLWDGLKDD